jgi:hypothetical protein
VTRGTNGTKGLAEGLDGRGDDGLTTTVNPLEGAEVEGALQLGNFGRKILGKFREEEIGANVMDTFYMGRHRRIRIREPNRKMEGLT